MMGSKLDVKLGVCGGEGRLEVGERTVGYDDGVAAFNGFIGDGLGQVDGQEGRVHLAADGVEGGFEQHCLVSE